MVCVARARGRGEDAAAGVAALGACRPTLPKLLIWDNAPPHHTRLVRQTAEATGIVLAWLPFRSPELNPCEDLWRRLKAVVAANRAYPSVDELATRATAWLDSLAPADVLRYAGLCSSKFDWLPTLAHAAARTSSARSRAQPRTADCRPRALERLSRMAWRVQMQSSDTGRR